MNGDLGDMHDGYCDHCGKGYCTDFGGPGGETCYGCGKCVDDDGPEVPPSRQVNIEEVEDMLKGVMNNHRDDMMKVHGIDIGDIPYDSFENNKYDVIFDEGVEGSPSSGNSHTFMGIERVLTKLEEQAIFMIFSGQTTELRMNKLLLPSDPDENGW